VPIFATESFLLVSSEKTTPFLVSEIFFLVSSDIPLPERAALIVDRCSALKGLPIFLSRIIDFVEAV